MDPMEFVADRCIRRALGFAGLAVGLVMLSLSFDLPLAFRSGASLVALVAVALLLAAWRTPRRDMRHSEAWHALNDLVPDLVSARSRQEMQQRLREVLGRRLIWHAERVGGLAVVLWLLAFAALVVKAR
jgi:hypothetical protein